MRRLLIIAALCSVLFASSPPAPGKYQCKEDQDEAAIKEAIQFINENHRHGYKFQLRHKDGRTVERQNPPCLLTLALTLVETKCHVVNHTPFDKCEPRDQQEVRVEAKCNVTICGGGDFPAIRRYHCDTEPDTSLARMCPDCPVLLPLDNENGLKGVNAAVKMFNQDSNHTSYFKLLEVGRTTGYYIPSIGTNYASEFAIVETECSDKATAEDENCEQKCHHEADYGFCKSTKRGNGELSVDCEIYNSTYPSHIPFFHGKHCEKPKDRPRPPGHQDKDKAVPDDSPPSHPGIHRAVPHGCYISLANPHHPHHHGGHHHGGHHHGGHHEGHPQGGHHEGHPHGGHPHGGHPHGGHPHGGPHDKKQKEHKDHSHGGDHDHEHDHDHKEPNIRPTGSPSDKTTYSGCPGLNKIRPSIHPICKFPSISWRKGPKLPQEPPTPKTN